MRLTVYFKLVFTSLLSTTLTFNIYAHSVSDVDKFIRKAKAPTYDCPDNALVPQIKHYLSLNNLTEKQRYELEVEHTHIKICNGDFSSTKATLEKIIDAPEVDKQSEYYAAALYQLSFIHDVQGDPERCDYYQKTLDISLGRFSDISLSSQLGLITECGESGQESLKLTKLFSLVEQYAQDNQKGELAHIHNNIGLLFGRLGQHGLATEQYLKSYELGFDIYTGSNKLSTLISAITSMLSTGDFEAANDAIIDFERINKDVNTPLTNYFEYYAKAGYYYRLNEFEKLRSVMNEWDENMPNLESNMHKGLRRWLAAVVCLHDGDKPCLLQFVEDEQNAPDSYRNRIGNNRLYLQFRTKVALALNDIDAATTSLNNYVAKETELSHTRQNSSRILGVANLYSKVVILENSIESSARTRRNTMLFTITGFVLFALVLLFLLRKKQLARLAIDPYTQLLNSKAALQKIAQIDYPSSKKVNALAIFDLANFKEVNRQIGSTKSDYTLKMIAQTLSNVTRDSDIVGRFGPEQFILCLPDIEEESAKMFFERARLALKTTFLDRQSIGDISVDSSMSIYFTSGRFNELNAVLDEMVFSLTIKSQ